MFGCEAVGGGRTWSIQREDYLARRRATGAAASHGPRGTTGSSTAGSTVAKRAASAPAVARACRGPAAVDEPEEESHQERTLVSHRQIQEQLTDQPLDRRLFLQRCKAPRDTAIASRGPAFR